MIERQTTRNSESDTLSEMLDAFPLPIRFVGRLELDLPWGLDVPEGLAAICCVRHGGFQLRVNDETEPIRVAEGDVVVLSPAARQRMQDSLDNGPISTTGLLEAARRVDGAVLSDRGKLPSTVLLGGIFEFSGTRAHPFYWILPPVVHLRRHEFDGKARMEGIVRLLEQEVSKATPGRQGIVNRLVEILFLRAVQLCLTEADQPAEEAIHGMMHPDLATALSRIHREPEKPWTVAGLAEQAAMSRSTFSATFVKVLGQPPLHYLRNHRMQIACRLLRDQTLGLKEIATRVGYDSASAFSTAFKRFAGTAPSDYRRGDGADQAFDLRAKQRERVPV